MDKERIEYNFPETSLKVSTVTFAPGMFLRNSHYHSAIELVYVHSGKLTCRVGDSVLSLSAYDTLLINKNVMHNIECPDRGTEFSYIQIETDRQFISSKKDETYFIRQFIDKSTPLQYYTGNENSELSDIFNNIFHECHSDEAYNILYLQAYILQLIAFMHRYKMIKEFNSNFLRHLESIKPIIQFINDNFTDKIYIDDLASAINLNKFQLCKRFKALTGGTIIEYINFIRLQHAAELLLNSDKSITEIAYSCGFASVQYFNKVCKKNFGCSPKNLKKH